MIAHIIKDKHKVAGDISSLNSLVLIENIPCWVQVWSLREVGHVSKYLAYFYISNFFSLNFFLFSIDS